MEEAERKKHNRVMWALLLMTLAVFSFLCEILSLLLVTGSAPEEIARSDQKDYPQNYVLDSWRQQHEQTNEDGSFVTEEQVRSYLRSRRLIVTTTQEDDWKELVHYGNLETEETAVEPAIVRLKMPQQTGSGVILQIQEDTLLISTCAHVIGSETEVRVTFFEGTEVMGTVVEGTTDFDLAYVEVAVQEIPYELRRKLRYAKVDEEAWVSLREDDDVFILASSRRPAGDYYEGYVQYREIYVPEFESYMLCVKSTPIPGMSGGGIFTMQGELIAMVNGGTASGQVVGLSLPVMIGQLTNFAFGVK